MTYKYYRHCVCMCTNYNIAIIVHRVKVLAIVVLAAALGEHGKFEKIRTIIGGKGPAHEHHLVDVVRAPLRLW